MAVICLVLLKWSMHCPRKIVLMLQSNSIRLAVSGRINGEVDLKKNRLASWMMAGRIKPLECVSARSTLLLGLKSGGSKIYLFKRNVGVQR